MVLPSQRQESRETGLVVPEQFMGGMKMEIVENDTDFSCGILGGRNRDIRKWQGGPRRDISPFLDKIYQNMSLLLISFFFS